MTPCRRYGWLLLVMGLTVQACGYRFAGSGTLPGNVTALAIHMLDNRTAEAGIETIVTNDLVNQFILNSRIKLMESDDAQAVLSGSVTGIRVDTASRVSYLESSERRVTVTVFLMLTHKDGRVLWQDGTLSDNEVYDVVTDNKAATNRNKRQAIAVLSNRLAEKAFNRLSDTF